MAITRSHSRLDVVFDASRTFFQHKLDKLRQTRAKHNVYRKTQQELAVLSDRDLKDLGIHRSNIKKVALEAAYGQ